MNFVKNNLEGESSKKVTFLEIKIKYFTTTAWKYFILWYNYMYTNLVFAHRQINGSLWCRLDMEKL